MENKKEMIHLMITIVERGQGETMAKLLKRHHIMWHYQSSGLGTASSEVLDVLGFGTKERDVLFSLASGDRLKEITYQLNNELRSEVKAKGITIYLPLSSISKSVYDFINHRNGIQDNEKRGDETVMSSEQSLIIVVVNQGHTDTVMETAKAAGARGGTILRSRWLGAEESEKLYGIALQEEKEIIAIVATRQSRNHIIESIQKKHGMNTEAGAMLCSINLEGLTGLG